MLNISRASSVKLLFFCSILACILPFSAEELALHKSDGDAISLKFTSIESAVREPTLCSFLILPLVARSQKA